MLFKVRESLRSWLFWIVKNFNSQEKMCSQCNETEMLELPVNEF